ncbi:MULTISPECIES: sigma-70 family RNA polymerase sigma factor [Idiomarinaceae]|uniref:RNA polymerase RpoE-like sigma-24 subunit n=5 Tax=Alteromonadales TaxID=135622 RepID=A0A368V1M8_9GAMM|nr:MULTISPECIES: sigma-70 family RNA polymerase sigma factor [Idiomarinaceae]MDT7525052.1 sigma-70 family RNA polymerase sigma factor [Pseudidiomarina sp. GXY010]PWW15013.1 RNA polymerase RpoE-like sigma-24 subunit [Pseudidiomarina maritima]RBP91557.1 RNA polymerase RpoE-like sigma-24 subunit [Pseudidiomarina tainanensis]RCW34986.1 RNA polymerase RpoE-like sigma-24 subunit [Pseudidiomarina tainanensis]
MPPAQPDNPEHAAELLAQIATEQSRAAFSELFKHFAPRLQAYATRQFGNEQTAMDLVQETMTNVWHKAHLFKPDRGSAATWIFTIARNIRFDFLRKNKYRQNDLSADDLWPVLAEQNESLDDDYALDDDLLMQQLAVYCEQLPPAQKTVIELIYIEGKSQQEVADALDIPLGTVKSRTRLALQKLKELIQHD